MNFAQIINENLNCSLMNDDFVVNSSFSNISFEAESSPNSNLVLMSFKRFYLLSFFLMRTGFELSSIAALTISISKLNSTKPSVG